MLTLWSCLSVICFHIVLTAKANWKFYEALFYSYEVEKWLNVGDWIISVHLNILNRIFKKIKPEISYVANKNLHQVHMDSLQ